MRILVKVITGDSVLLLASCTMRRSSPMDSQMCEAVMSTYAMPMCVMFASNRSDVVLNTSAGEVTDNSQSAKDIDPYFMSQLCVGPGSLILPNGLSKPG